MGKVMAIEGISLTFSALSDPTRRAIIERLSLGEASVSELAEPFRMSMPAITKHIKVLEQAGLITKTREAQRQRCALNGDPLREISDWINHYKKFWDESFDRLDDYLATLQSAQKTSRKKGVKRGRKSKK